MQARHEYKHSLNYADYIFLRDRLDKTMQRDSHADQNGEYRVRSLYFDSPGDEALRAKIHGVDRREKFRIRRYIGEDDFLVLEKKVSDMDCAINAPVGLPVKRLNSCKAAMPNGWLRMSGSWFRNYTPKPDTNNFGQKPSSNIFGNHSSNRRVTSELPLIGRFGQGCFQPTF